MSEQIRLADYVFEFVARQGVGSVFLVPGGGAMYLVDALGQNSDLEFVPNHHEQASAIAAEAYARVNGHLGVALVTTGPGSTNAITGVVGGWIDSTPMLMISGQVKRADLMGDSGVRQQGPQEVDIISIVETVTKYAVTVMEKEDIRYHLEKAVHLATSGRRGPVWLDIPLDIQASYIDPDSLRGFDVPKSDQSDLSTQTIDDILAHIKSAERPLILAGQGIRSADAATQFKALYEQLEVPVVTTWNAMDLISADHPLSVGKPGVVALRAPNFAVQNCDLLISIGARLDNIVTAYNSRNFARAAKKIIVDVDANELAKHEMEMEISVQADALDVINALLAQSKGETAPSREKWLQRCQSWKERYPIADGKPLETTGEISHYYLIKCLSDKIPEDTLVVTGSSGLGVEAFYSMFHNKNGQRVFHTTGLGSMGFGLAAAIGACKANDSQPMVCVESDGSMMMNLQELQTVKSLNLPIRIFLINNNGYASIRNTQRNYFDSRYVATGPESGLELPDFADLAKSLGIEAVKVEDAADLPSKLEEVMAMRGPVFCDIRVVANESLWPKSAALPQPDGSMLSMPLEDMTPLLPREELREQMMIPLLPVSEQASDDKG